MQSHAAKSLGSHEQPAKHNSLQKKVDDMANSSRMKIVLILVSVLVTTLHPSEALQCFVDGSCEGGQPAAGYPDMMDANECLKACKKTAECKWFVFNSPKNFCRLHSDCPVKTNLNCRGLCQYGEVDCEEIKAP